jgi:hypothetical protein
MAYLEELLPEFRKGAKIRRECWRKHEYIYQKRYTLLNEEDIELDGTEMDIWDIFDADDWELYKDPEPDWQYIIDHKCLCWFWRQDVNFKLISVLREITNNLFIDTLGNCWENCRPVRKDEVTFYEDKEK